MSRDSDRPATDRPRPRRLLEDGLLTGLVGAGVLAVWFLGIDVLRGQPLITPSVLSAVVFDGGTVADATITIKDVFAYSGLHVILFLMVGFCIALMFKEFELAPNVGTALLLLFVLGEVILFGIQVAMMEEVLGAIGQWQTAVGNTLSAVAMFWFMLRRYPGSMGYLVSEWHSRPALR
jgi:hypothetical protein